MEKILIPVILLLLLLTGCGVQPSVDLTETVMKDSPTPGGTPEVTTAVATPEPDLPDEEIYPIKSYGTVLSDGSIAYFRYYHEPTRRYDKTKGEWYDWEEYTSEVYLQIDGVEQLLYTFEDAKIWSIFVDKYKNIYCHIAYYIYNEIPLNQIVKVEQDKYSVMIDFSDMDYGSADLWLATESGIYFVDLSTIYKYDFETKETVVFLESDDIVFCKINTYYCSFVLEGQKYFYYDMKNFDKSLKRPGEKGRYRVSLDKKYALTHNFNTGEYWLHSAKDSTYNLLKFDEEDAGFSIFGVYSWETKIDDFYVGDDKIYYFVPKIDDRNYTTLKLYTSELDGSNVIEDADFYIEPIKTPDETEKMKCLCPVILNDVIYFLAGTADEKPYRIYRYNIKTNELVQIKKGQMKSRNHGGYLQLMGDQVYFYILDLTNDRVDLEYIIETGPTEEQ